jgi:hypothetical protein
VVPVCNHLSNDRLSYRKWLINLPMS